MPEVVRVMPEFRWQKLTIAVNAWGMPAFQRFHGFRTYTPAGHTTALHNGRTLANARGPDLGAQNASECVGNARVPVTEAHIASECLGNARVPENSGFQNLQPSGHTTTLHNGRALINATDPCTNEQHATD